MKSIQASTDKTGGIITIYDKDDDYRSLSVPPAGSDVTVRLAADGLKARKIHMIDIPSAATITWNSKEYVDGKPKWWITLKTTHAPAELDKADIDQYVNRNAKDTFIRTGLGILVLDKSETTANPDSLGEVVVKISAPSKTSIAHSTASVPAHGEPS
ncbi:hypothetical protein ABE484_17440 [Pseudomonas pudica]|uniref:hypothetical protein n=1 Tax=Pseudomonas TaxID=286 RepID=UPI000A1E3F47|nr:hypothetical protein [Pseudomonas sp. B10(2017)]